MDWKKTVLVCVAMVVVGGLAFKGVIPKEYVLALLALFVPSPLSPKQGASILAGHDVTVIPSEAPTKPGGLS